MRLFTALDLPPDVVLRLETMLKVLRPEAEIKWSPPENLHITTKFIGEWPEALIDQLDTALQETRFRKPLQVLLRGLGWFPNAHSPRVFWAGIDGGSALLELAALTDNALSSIGVAKEEHPFSPHLTLARIRQSVPLHRLHARVEELQPADLGEFQADSFYLYSSQPGSHANIYRKLRTYKFEQP